MFGNSAKVRVKSYRHCDVANLAQKLKRYVRPGDRVMVISDAVFSMDGDIAPLPEMLDVLANYPGSILVMDEAHASGSIEPTGGGIYEHFGIKPQQAIEHGIVPLIMTTFSKFAASVGAAISSNCREFIDLLDASPTSITTASVPPPATAAALEAIRQTRQNPQLVQALQANAGYLRSRLLERDFNPLGETHVIPIILPGELNPKAFARQLIEEHGIWVSPIWFVAKPRLRIVANALHSREEMDLLVEAMAAVRNALYPTNRVS
ncbi:MAG: aminotransferase class I/II-fold pyridoxal phosphate-dependent enzyme [Oscillatoria sp. SIO1A7]|nr:aminotransferase class I/II-fold pyridoxal phosphate-dependent enzyme [Oscillatoria sp. SIO1A7]